MEKIFENIGKYWEKLMRFLKKKNEKNSIAIDEFVEMPEVREAQIANRTEVGRRLKNSKK